jgi:hypothetical protein
MYVCMHGWLQEKRKDGIAASSSRAPCIVVMAPTTELAV